MPNLNFKGKQTIWNHHNSPLVPLHTLRKNHDLSLDTTKPTTNHNHILLQADNLIGLKALLPQYEAKVKCIYIDPPYNTGNEGWVYNDKVNNPMISNWLGKTVGLDDLTRHDKWLCMMTPRLKLLQRLMSDDGVIFVSIDDNEVHHLRMLMDEIWGETNFVADFIWNHRKSSQNDVDVSLSHNHTLTFAKNRTKTKLSPLEIDISKFNNPDNDPRGEWVADPFDAPNIRPNLTYEITNPNTGEVFLPTQGRHWRTTKDKFEEMLLDNRIIWGKTGKTKPQFKRFKSEAEDKGTNPFTIWSDIGTATEGTKELMELFDGQKVFETPKPVSFIKKCLKLGSNPDSIIIDSFAGSGTTAQAVMELNAEDGGNRQFILVQMTESTDDNPDKNICRDITRERIARVINKKNMIGVGFDYLELGISMDKWNLVLAESDADLPTFVELGSFILSNCMNIKAQVHNHGDYLLHRNSKEVIILVYEPLIEFVQGLGSSLTFDLATEMINRYGKLVSKIVYATSCCLDEEYLTENNICYINYPMSF